MSILISRSSTKSKKKKKPINVFNQPCRTFNPIQRDNLANLSSSSRPFSPSKETTILSQDRCSFRIQVVENKTSTRRVEGNERTNERTKLGKVGCAGWGGGEVYGHWIRWIPIPLSLPPPPSIEVDGLMSVARASAPSSWARTFRPSFSVLTPPATLSFRFIPSILRLFSTFFPCPYPCG